MHIDHDIGTAIKAPRLGSGCDTVVEVVVKLGRGPDALASSSVRRGSV